MLYRDLKSCNVYLSAKARCHIIDARGQFLLAFAVEE